jgi:hypothetical protein
LAQLKQIRSKNLKGDADARPKNKESADPPQKKVLTSPLHSAVTQISVPES